VKKIAPLIIIILVAAFHVVAQDTEQEKDFISRLEAFQKAGDMDKMTNIVWYDKSPESFQEFTTHYFESVVVRGIKSVKYEPVPSALASPTSIDGKSYVPNLTPYKMVSVDYQTIVKNGSEGFSMITGIKDGKIFICGLKEKSKP
jgi:hypothetical protein